MSPTKIVALGLIGLVVFGPLSSQSETYSTEPARFSIVIKSRKVDTSGRTIRTTQGMDVEINFTANEAVELHLHGYDQLLTVKPGSVAVMRLHAKIAGRFAIEGHHFGSGAGGTRSRGHTVLLYLEVHP